MPQSSLKYLGQDSRTRKKTESYTMVRQGQREHLTDFLQRLSKAVQIGVAVPDAR